MITREKKGVLKTIIFALFCLKTKYQPIADNGDDLNNPINWKNTRYHLVIATVAWQGR
jgi:hypothetical protein